MSRFDELEIGQTAEIRRRVSAEDITAFVNLTGDTNPVHVDAAFAARAGLGKPVAHGMLTASFISTLIGTVLPGPGALWYSQTLEFVNPVLVGDTIRVRATVKHKSPSLRVVTMEVEVVKDDGSVVVRGESRVRVTEPRAESQGNGASERGAAIVTGAGRGIGAAIAKRLAAAGHPTLVNYRTSRDDAHAVVEEIERAGGRAWVFEADVTDERLVARMVDDAVGRAGGVDVLVNNAMANPEYQRFEELTWDALARALETQLKSVLLASRAVLPGMVARKRGSVINIGSLYAETMPPERMYGYVAAKAALAAFTRSMAVEYGPKGIRVNCVAPAMTQTAMIAGVPEREKMVAAMRTPLRRLANPEDVAGVVAFLASDDGAYLAGKTIRVDGGQSV